MSLTSKIKNALVGKSAGSNVDELRSRHEAAVREVAAARGEPAPNAPEGYDSLPLHVHLRAKERELRIAQAQRIEYRTRDAYSRALDDVDEDAVNFSDSPFADLAA